MIKAFLIELEGFTIYPKYLYKRARAASMNSDQNAHSSTASDLSLPLFPLKEWSDQGLHPQTTFLVETNYMNLEGAQWLSGRVLDSRPKGRGFEPHRRHCVVSLSKTHLS